MGLPAAAVTAQTLDTSPGDLQGAPPGGKSPGCGAGRGRPTSICTPSSAFSRPHCRTFPRKTLLSSGRQTLSIGVGRAQTYRLKVRSTLAGEGGGRRGRRTEAGSSRVSAQWWPVVTHRAQEEGGKGTGGHSRLRRRGMGGHGKHGGSGLGSTGSREGVGRQGAGAHWPAGSAEGGGHTCTTLLWPALL